MPALPVGSPVRLVLCAGLPLPVEQQLRAVVSGNTSACEEYEVTFPLSSGETGFDFWPFEECELDTDPSPISPFPV